MNADNPFVRDPQLDFDDVDTLSDDQAREQVERLREALDFHDYRYYVQNDPVIADRAYDQLFRRLEALEEAFPELQSPNSPTRRVGAEPLDSLERVEHVAPMLSLNAEFEADNVAGFDKFIRDNLDGGEFTYVCEPKFDGLSVEILYENGELTRASTRGNGEEGELVTDNVRTIHAVPLRLQGDDYPDFLAVRGEVLMPKSGFQELNKRRIERGDDPFANPRNAAAGTVRLLDPSQVAQRPLDIFFYDVMDASAPVAETECRVLDRFPRWGLKIDEHSRRCETLEEVEAFYASLEEVRDELDYEIDGMVIKVNEFAHRERLGVRSRSPRWALAWKFTPKKEITTLEQIVVQVGRTGKLTPVALLDPVDVGGVTVSRATLHNIEEVHAKDVRVGDTVRIQRAGDVIPEVVERIDTANEKGGEDERGEPFEMPEHCPSCGAEVVREGPNHFCPNGMSCPAQLRGRIQHFAARNAMDIEGLGEETVEQLVSREMVRSIPDLYELDVDAIAGLERFADKSARKLYDNIQGSKKVRLHRFLFALGIPMVGQHTARLLAEAFGSLDALRDADEEALLEVSGVGSEIAGSVVDFFDEEQNERALERLFDMGLELEEPPSAGGEAERPLEGKKFVFTGSLADFTRSEAKRRVEDLGARATSSVSGETDYVVVGDNPGSKLDQARELGVEILDEEAFGELLSGL
ncbi:NAD-dependent DNA ligase LigA [Persicimonas caeni]|nr:NAD-dependent DNA ligase LigA [Persicimonas caeni]